MNQARAWVLAAKKVADAQPKISVDQVDIRIDENGLVVLTDTHGEDHDILAVNSLQLSQDGALRLAAWINEVCA